jgi:hypothetical protein
MKKIFLVTTLFLFVAGLAYAANPAVTTTPVKQAVKKELKKDMKKGKKIGPCKADREKFCAGVEKGKKVHECLKANKEKLTPICKDRVAKRESLLNKKIK